MIANQPRFGRLALLAGSTISLGTLFIFKYFNFFIETVASRLAFTGMDVSDVTLRLALPIGISFFTFQAVGYMADVHRGKVEAERNPVNLFLFISFFPQLVAGPIERADHLLQEFKTRRSITDSDVGYGAYLIVQGYVKKIVIADNLKPIVDTLFAYDDLSAPLIIAGLLGFTFQIYGDFSGYTDIARGVAKLMDSIYCSTSAVPIGRLRLPNSGVVGISPSAIGSTITCTSRWAAIGRAPVEFRSTSS